MGQWSISKGWSNSDNSCCWPLYGRSARIKQEASPHLKGGFSGWHVLGLENSTMTLCYKGCAQCNYGRGFPPCPTWDLMFVLFTVGIRLLSPEALCFLCLDCLFLLQFSAYFLFLNLSLPSQSLVLICLSLLPPPCPNWEGGEGAWNVFFHNA